MIMRKICPLRGHILIARFARSSLRLYFQAYTTRSHLQSFLTLQIIRVYKIKPFFESKSKAMHSSVEFLERIDLILAFNIKLICNTNDTLICKVIVKILNLSYGYTDIVHEYIHPKV